MQKNKNLIDNTGNITFLSQFFSWISQKYLDSGLKILYLFYAKTDNFNFKGVGW